MFKMNTDWMDCVYLFRYQLCSLLEFSGTKSKPTNSLAVFGSPNGFLPKDCHDCNSQHVMNTKIEDLLEYWHKMNSHVEMIEIEKIDTIAPLVWAL